MKIDRYNIQEHLIDKQFSYINKCLKDALENRNWRNEWSISMEDSKSFEEYSIPLIKKCFKINKTKAQSVFNNFILNYGLQIK